MQDLDYTQWDNFPDGQLWPLTPNLRDAVRLCHGIQAWHKVLVLGYCKALLEELKVHDCSVICVDYHPDRAAMAAQQGALAVNCTWEQFAQHRGKRFSHILGDGVLLLTADEQRLIEQLKPMLSVFGVIRFREVPFDLYNPDHLFNAFPGSLRMQQISSSHHVRHMIEAPQLRWPRTDKQLGHIQANCGVEVQRTVPPESLPGARKVLSDIAEGPIEVKGEIKL